MKETAFFRGSKILLKY
uniref:Uncharacterized protein n=1 Tax=Anguilla anguilla TaxID=7936 RepID=A0A0E9TK23_ANGAN